RPVARGRQSVDRNRGRAPDGPPACATRRAARGDFLGRERVGGAAGRARDGRARRKRADRDDPLRRRGQVSERAFLGRGVSMIRVANQPWREMVAHARATYPNECVGAMLGRMDGPNKEVLVAMRLENSTAGSQRARYELRPEDLLAADKEARRQGLDLVGI